MAAFHLSLNQVNFDGDALEREELLDSFSNLYCYDSDFKVDASEGTPVTAKQVQHSVPAPAVTQGNEEELPGLIHHRVDGFLSQGYIDYNYGPQTGKTHKDSAENKVTDLHEGFKRRSGSDTEEYFAAKMQMKSNRTASGGSSKVHGGANRSLALEPSENSFEAFTKTVEALALQRSVINNRDIAPASPEDIAAAIASAQEKMAATSQVSDHRQDSVDAMSTEVELAACDNDNDDSILVAMTQYDDDSVNDGGSGGDVDNVSRSSSEHQLIRVPQDQISMSSEKASWFSRKVVTRPEPCTPTKTEKSSAYKMDADEGDVTKNVNHAASKQIREQQISADVCHVDSEHTTEVAFNGGLSVSGSEVNTSTPCKDVRRLSTGSEQSAAQSTNDTLSLASDRDDVEVAVPQETRVMTTRKLDTTGGNKNVSESLEIARLQGQLEVLSAEAETALRERAQLQSQLAAAGEKLRQQESASATAADRRRDMMADLETLRQNRTRLEQVIMDAHKLLADKDADIEAVRVDLELSNQSSSKLEEQMKELHRQLSARDGTVSALKAKVAELYVSTETTAQALSAAQREVASLQRDVSAVTTTRDWYHSELSRVQATCGELRQDVGTTRSEVVSLATQLERVRAEKAATERRLADVRQRAIADKRQLARHLEAIEADMVQRAGGESRLVDEDVEPCATNLHDQPDLLEGNYRRDRSDSVERDRSSTTDRDMEVCAPDRELVAALSASQTEVLVLRDRATVTDATLASARRELVELEAALEEMRAELDAARDGGRRLEEDIRQRDGRIQKLTVENDALQVKVDEQASELNQKTVTNTMEKAADNAASQQLEVELASSRQQLLRLEAELKKAELRAESAERQVVLSSERALEQKLKAVEEEETKQPSPGEDALKRENDALRDELANLQRESHKVVAKLKAKALKLGHDLQATLAEKRSGQKAMSSEVDTLTDRLAALEAERTKALDALAAREESFSMSVDERTAQLQQQLKEQTQAAEADLQAQKLVEAGLRASLLEAESRIAELSIKLDSMEQELSEAKLAVKDVEDARSLALDLQREKGRLEGALQSHATLKAHASRLEQQLAGREASATEASGRTSELLRQRDDELRELQAVHYALQQETGQLSKAVKDSSKQLLKERSGQAKLRRQLDALGTDRDRLMTDAQQHADALAAVTADQQRALNAEGELRAQLEQTQTALDEKRVEAEQWRREAEQGTAKGDVVADEMKAMKWQLEQSDKERTAIVDQLHLVEERQQLQVDELKAALQTSANELKSTHEELDLVTQEKSSAQITINRLKSVLQSALDNHQAQASSQSHPQLVFDVAAIEKLLSESANPAPTGKTPLTFLQATLSQLRGEISSLQEQVDLHSITVHNSTISRKEVEQHVKDLREVIKTSASNREASLQQQQQQQKRMPPGDQNGNLPTADDDSLARNNDQKPLVAVHIPGAVDV